MSTYPPGYILPDLNQIKKIIILGGGTSGWLSALILSKKLRNPIEIVLIEDVTAGPIGVGEGTQPITANTLANCGIPLLEWMKSSKATYKMGVELVGWSDNSYFVDNDYIQNSILFKNVFKSVYFTDKPYTDFLKHNYVYKFAKDNLSPKLNGNLDLNFNVGPTEIGAVHFSAYDILETIKSHLPYVKHIDAKIIEVETTEKGISKLIDETGQEYTADLYLDCSGFKSLLLDKVTESDNYESYSPWLFNDRSVVIQTQYKDPKQECHPYTKATAMNSGWAFKIPIFTRIGNGYVYSSKYISDADAEKELREHLNEWESPAKFIDMKCGRHKTIASKNVCAIGLSAGFIEPLEATTLSFTTLLTNHLVFGLNRQNNIWTENLMYEINKEFGDTINEFFTFVWSHYYFSTKNDTEYWKDIRKLTIDDLPENIKLHLLDYYPLCTDFLFTDLNKHFSSTQWFSVINSADAYKGSSTSLTKEEQEYCKYSLRLQENKYKIAKEFCMNHYEYLQQWYNT